MHVASHRDLKPFVTKDGSTIREWATPGSSPVRNQSLAEARVSAGGATSAHYHRTSEELYLVTAGRAVLRVGGRRREVEAGDCALIPPGEVHSLENVGDDELVVVCACSPPYSHEDTVLADVG